MIARKFYPDSSAEINVYLLTWQMLKLLIRNTPFFLSP